MNKDEFKKAFLERLNDDVKEAHEKFIEDLDNYFEVFSSQESRGDHKIKFLKQYDSISKGVLYCYKSYGDDLRKHTEWARLRHGIG